MSDTNPGSGNTPTSPQPAAGGAAAQEAFGKYKARLAGGPIMMPGWAMPPSMGALPNYPSANPFAPPGVMRPHPMGSLTERLGSTVRLGVDLLNAALARGASMLGGGAMQWDSHGCGCGSDRCGYDCCDAMASECCRPGAHGCGCC
jgi:hypothetical protein